MPKLIFHMKRLYFDLIFICSTLLIYCAGCHSDKNTSPNQLPIGVTVFRVEPQTIPQDFEFVGVAKSSHLVEIRSRVEGYLDRIAYLEGGMVKENDLLFKIDPRQFEASVDEALGVLEMKEAILWRAQQNLSRIKPLYQKNAASKRDLDNALADTMTGEAGVMEAKGNLVKAELNLSYTDITSPIKGLAGKSIYREGTLITPSINGLLTYVSVIDPIWVYFSISDNQVLMGQGESAENQLILPAQQDYTVHLKLSDGSIFPYLGQVNFSSPSLDPETGSLLIRAVFANTEGKLLPGQFVQAIVSGAMRPNAIFVPQQSVFQGKNGMYVFVVDSQNKVASRLIVAGEWYRDFWIIKQGLNKGDLVIVDGVNRVEQGSSVHVVSVFSPANPPPKPGQN